MVTANKDNMLAELLGEVRGCVACAPYLSHGPRPVVQAHSTSRILIVGQAPGRRVHETGIPFNDPSGDRLREWLGVNRETFYDASLFALLPMGFCYPGTGKSGDLPPRPECAPLWRERLLALLTNVRLTLVIGQYAMEYHLPTVAGNSVTERVLSWREWGTNILPLPHPSPRNNLWLRRNPWFEAELLPHLKSRVADVLFERL